MWAWVSAAIGMYFAIGIVFFFILINTPYQEVAKWAIILWPLWVIAMFKGEF